MNNYLGDFELGKTIPFLFCTYNSSGASVTITGLAVTDIEIYKNGSITQRSSDNGYALIDTDGIDIDGITGLHGFTVDTSDNSDAGFYAAGNDYTVVVSTITADSQTVTFIAGRFSLVNRVGAMQVADSGTAAAIAAGTITLRSGHGIANVASVLIVLTGGTDAKGKSRIATYSGSGDVFNVSPAWNANGESTPSGTITYLVFPIPLASTSAPVPVDVTKWNGTAVATPATAGYPAVTVKVGTGTGEVNLSGGKAPATIAAGDIGAGALTALALAGDAGVEIATAVLDAATAAPIAANIEQINTVPVTGDGSAGDKFDVV